MGLSSSWLNRFKLSYVLTLDVTLFDFPAFIFEAAPLLRWSAGPPADQPLGFFLLTYHASPAAAK